MKRLVVCLDGTWNSVDSGGGETNVARLARAVSASSKGRDPTSQLTLYLRGVGSTGSTVDRLLDGITGDGVDENIRSAYMFIAQNYVPGDGLFIFGFSRGAFTARSLCGLIGSVGILKRQSIHKVSAAWAYYRKGGSRSSQDFCACTEGASCHDSVEIDFLGVWDTVGALGVPGGLNSLTAPKYEFHDTTPSLCVRRARHALAIDECRDEFVPTFWTVDRNRPDLHEAMDIQQVWFAGAHSDVGGGYPEKGLSDIPLVWMAQEASRPTVLSNGTTRPGLVLDWEDVLPKIDGSNALASQHNSRQGVFALDRVTPTYRRVCQIDREVDRWAWLYVPTENGRELATINESVHPSVWRRLNTEVRVLTGKRGKRVRYAPMNLPPQGSVRTWSAPSPAVGRLETAE